MRFPRRAGRRRAGSVAVLGHSVHECGGRGGHRDAVQIGGTRPAAARSGRPACPVRAIRAQSPRSSSSDSGSGAEGDVPWRGVTAFTGLVIGAPYAADVPRRKPYYRVVSPFQCPDDRVARDPRVALLHVRPSLRLPQEQTRRAYRSHRLHRHRPPDDLPRPLRRPAGRRPAAHGLPLLPGRQARRPPRRRRRQHLLRHGPARHRADPGRRRRRRLRRVPRLARPARRRHRAPCASPRCCTPRASSAPPTPTTTRSAPSTPAR